MSFSFILESFKTGIILIFVLALMLLTLRLLAKYQNKLSGNKNIKILERATLSQNTTLNIVKVGEKFYLMSSSSGGVKILKELQEEEIDEQAYSVIPVENMDISSLLKKSGKYIERFRGKFKDEEKRS